MTAHQFAGKTATEILPRLLVTLLRAPTHNSRAGGVHELTMAGIMLTDPAERYLQVAGRRHHLPAQMVETAWVLAGRDDLDLLAHYIPRVRDFSDDGGVTWRSAYGPRLRSYAGVIDQLDYVVDTLTEDPTSRQAVVSLWDPTVDTTPGKDKACNDFLVFSNRLGRLDLHVTVRSNDVIWGWSGINAFEWSTLQEIVAQFVGVKVGTLHFSIGSLHLYDRHLEKAHRIAMFPDSPALQGVERPSPRFTQGAFSLDGILALFFNIEAKLRHGEDARELIETFPEPMFQSWLRVLEWWWTGDHNVLWPLAGTSLEMSTHYSVQPPTRTREEPETGDTIVSIPTPAPDNVGPTRSLQGLFEVHAQKHEAYGNSWMKRGELFSILPNIARKIDRLVSGKTTDDENLGDTTGDLLVYLGKYASWLSHMDVSTVESTERHLTQAESLAFAGFDGKWVPEGSTLESVAKVLDQSLDALMENAQGDPDRGYSSMASRYSIVTEEMLPTAYRLWRHYSAEPDRDGDDYRGADVD